MPFGLALAATGIPMFMATLDNLVITNALPVIHEELGASVEELQWFMNAYTLVFASLILFAVALGDRIGRRTMFLAGIVIFTGASVFAALSTDPTQLIVARAMQGIGGAGIMPLSLSLLAGAVEARLRPLAIGIWGGIAGLGVAVGPLVGGAVVEGWSWEAIFWDQRARRHPRAAPSSCSRFPTRSGRGCDSTFPEFCSPASGCSESSSASCAATTRAGTRSRCSRDSSAARF